MAKRKDPLLERRRKSQLWVLRTMNLTGYDEALVRRILSTPRLQSFRINPLVRRPLETSHPTAVSGVDNYHFGSPVAHTVQALKESGFAIQPVMWDAHEVGYHCSKSDIAALNRSEFTEQGEVYVQNAASWLPVLALNPQPGENILDVCAAPGGKASHIQALTLNQSTLTCNDNSKPRLLSLQRNMERLGAVASYTLCDAAKISQKFAAEAFDKILLDAPCSGEGLMTLLPGDEKLFDSWSVAHIRRLSQLQKKILTQAWKLLKPGGTLVYSTCTTAPEENEVVVDYLLRKNPDARLASFPTLQETEVKRLAALQTWNDRTFTHDLSPCLRLLPSPYVEAFFVAKLVKHV